MLTVDEGNKLNRVYKGHNIDYMLGNTFTQVNKISGSRLNLFDTHLRQWVHIINPEPPLIFTGYENELGRHSDGYKTATSDYVIVAKVFRYKSNPLIKYMLIIQDMRTGIFDCVEIKRYEKLSAEHGYVKKILPVDKKSNGDIIKENEFFYSSNSLDDNGNYQFGLNANSVKLSFLDVADDAVIISRSFSKRGSYNVIEEKEMNLCANDIGLNIYGDINNYKMLPGIGEYIPNETGILCAKRTIDYSKAANEITNNALMKTQDGDTLYDGKGMIIDFNILVNNHKELDNGPYRQQLKDIYEEQLRYNQEILDVLEPIVRNRNVKSSHYLRFIYNNARKYVNNSILDGRTLYQYATKNGIIEFAHLTVTTIHVHELDEGDKMTDRFGTKGVVNEVWEDWMMPTDAYGEVADVITSNTFVSRANSGQLYESELNFIASRVIDQARKLKTFAEQFGHINSFLRKVSSRQSAFADKAFNKMSNYSKEEYLKDIYKNGLRIHQPPFYENASLMDIDELYSEFNTEPKRLRICIDSGHISQYDEIYSEKEISDMIRIRSDYIHSDIKSSSTIMPNLLSVYDRACKMRGEKGIYTDKENNVHVSDTTGEAYYMPNHSYGLLDLYKHNLTKEEDIQKIKEDHKTIRNTSEGITKEEFIEKETVLSVDENGNVIRNMRSLCRAVIGKQYFIVLKQTADQGFSSRSVSSMNQLGLPVKYKKAIKPFSNNSVRCGEMETFCLLRRLDSNVVYNFIAERSSNPEMRNEVNRILLNEDPFQYHSIPNPNIGTSIPAKIISEYMLGIGVEIKRGGVKDIYSHFDDIDDLDSYFEDIKKNIDK